MKNSAEAINKRARLLAALMGHADPDERIVHEGKEMPAWCSFRKTAEEDLRKERLSELERERMQMPIHRQAALEVAGKHDDATLHQMRRCMSYGRVRAGVLCADGHLGYSQPVGGAIAYEDQVSISGVGYDIGCGNMAARLDVKIGDLAQSAETLAEDISKAVVFGAGKSNPERADYPVMDDDAAWKASGMEDIRSKAAAQLGTAGSGNHYVDLFSDQDGWVWIGVHFGSRGLGHATASRYLRLAGGKDGIHAKPTLVSDSSDLGGRYIAAMHLCGRYAFAGRHWAVDRVRRIIGASVVETVRNHHNYAWREWHSGRYLWVVRKGATPAWPGERCFVGGSMGDDAVILRGVDGPRSEDLLRSTVHGAGRVLGRREARRRLDRAGMEKWMRRRRIALAGGGVDESPWAYRRLPDVLRHHAGTVEVVATLRPFVVVMAGPEERR